MNNTKLILLASLYAVCSCQKEPVFTEHTLPVLVLTIDEEFLWSPDSGLYIVGQNGAGGCTYLDANYNQKWEYPVRLRYYINNELQFDETAGFRIKGNCSRILPMKSIGIYWRSEYGNRSLKYPIFPDIPVSEYKRLFLRNSGNDFGKTHIKDAAISRIFRDHARVDYQEYQPCVLYLNNEYWGICNIREMITPHHFENHYPGVDDDSVDLLLGSEENPQIDDGSSDGYLADIVEFIRNNDLNDPVNYAILSERMDIESYMDYIIVETYICNTDWPCNNSKWWRDASSEDHQKWRWVIFDTDFSFRLDNAAEVWIGDLYYNSGNRDRNSGFFLFNHLIRNTDFRTSFLERYLFFINVVFDKERVRNIILETMDMIASEYPYHQDKWKSLPVGKWKKEVRELIEFNNRRNDIMREIIIRLQNE